MKPAMGDTLSERCAKAARNARDLRYSGDKRVDHGLAALFDEATTALRAMDAVPVDQWEKVIDECVLLYVVHDNAQYESDEERRKSEWEGWCVGRWTDFNKGGWTWHGRCGQVTHVSKLIDPPSPDKGNCDG